MLLEQGTRPVQKLVTHILNSFDGNFATDGGGQNCLFVVALNRSDILLEHEVYVLRLNLLLRRYDRVDYLHLEDSQTRFEHF